MIINMDFSWVTSKFYSFLEHEEGINDEDTGFTHSGGNPEGKWKIIINNLVGQTKSFCIAVQWTSRGDTEMFSLVMG